MRINKTLKTIFFTLLFFGIYSSLFHSNAFAATTRPYYGWTYTIGGTGNDRSRGIAVDSQDNIYTTGIFNADSVEFNTTGAGSSDIKTASGSGIFVTKYNANGSYGWTRVIGGVGANQGSGIVVDNNDNIYFTGFFSGTNVEFNTTGSGSSDLKSSNGNNDIFITKYNSDGSYGWTRAIGGSGNDQGSSVAIDPSGDVFLLAFLNSSNTEYNTTGSGASDIYSTTGIFDITLTRYTTSGNYVWTRKIGGTGSDLGNSVHIDSIGNIYIGGSFNSTNIEFNTTGSGSSDIRSTTGQADIFITKYTNSGGYVWTRTIGSTTNDAINYISSDNLNNIYFTGTFQGSNTQFNTTGAGSSDPHSTAGSNDMFITKYNSDGSYGWTRTIGGTASESSTSIATDNNNNIYFTGNNSSTNVEFNTTGSGPSDIFSTNGGTDSFITKYNSDGSYAWTVSGGGTSTEAPLGIGLNSNNDIYITGFYSSNNADFNITGFGSPDTHSFAGAFDSFTTKISDGEIKVNILESGLISDNKISITEGNNSNYTIVLNTYPTEDALINLSFESGISISPSTLTFTTFNWNIPQTITVSAINDDLVSGDRTVTISHPVTSDDSLYNGISVPDMTVNIIEDDTPTTTPKKTSVGAGVGIGNTIYTEVELEEEIEEENEITITPTSTKTIKPTNLPETGKDGEVKGEGIKFTTVALCSFPLVIVVIIMILAARKKKKNNEN